MSTSCFDNKSDELIVHVRSSSTAIFYAKVLISGLVSAPRLGQ